MTGDPTYPLYPVACLLSAAFLPLVLTTSFTRQRWNLGVTLLSFWLFLENLTSGINAIIWSNNTAMKLFIYCDIVSHLQLICFIVKPMSTLIIIRRLYLIVNLRSVDASSWRQNWISEWTLGVILPLIVAGPLYYTVQNHRFEVIEGIGCTNAVETSVLSVLLLTSWAVISPLVSVTVYYPRVVLVFSRHSREVNHFLRSNSSVSRTNYFRILALASIDIFFTLPMGIINVSFSALRLSVGSDSGLFYSGWDSVHSHWAPVGYVYTPGKMQAYFTFSYWTSPILAFAIFGLFGMTRDARITYWNVASIARAWLGCMPAQRGKSNSALGSMEFGSHWQESVTTTELPRQPQDLEVGAPSVASPDGVVHSLSARLVATERGLIRPHPRQRDTIE